MLMKQKITHYDRLGVSNNATPSEIRTAFKRLAQRHHPDRHQGSAEAVRVMTMLNVAYSTLTDPVRRQAYDEKLQEQMAPNREIFGRRASDEASGDEKAGAEYVPVNPWELSAGVKVIAVILVIVAWIMLRN